jgi:hypothetical protein
MNLWTGVNDLGRMIHHFKQWLTVEELKNIVAANASPREGLAGSRQQPKPRWPALPAIAHWIGHVTGMPQRFSKTEPVTFA